MSTTINPKELAKLLREEAEKDVLNSKGRIIISEFKENFNLPALTADEIIQAWKKTWPDTPIEQRTPNVIVIIVQLKLKEKARHRSKKA